MNPVLGVVTLLQWHKVVDRRIVRRESVLDVQPVFPRQETRQPKVHPNLMTFEIDAGSGPYVIVTELRNERVGLLAEVLILKLHIAQPRRLAEGETAHEAVIFNAGFGVMRGLKEQLEGIVV